MAYRPLYSGDLAGLNVAAADQERNANAARSGNQAFLQGLAQVAAARSGQASQERMGAADRENRMAMAQLADATNRYSTDTNAALGRQRNANDLLSSIQRNEQALARLMVERDRIAALERQGIATNQLEKDRLEAAGKQIAAELTNRMEIARLQFNPENRRVDSRTATEIIAGNAAIDESNQQAAGLAEVLNSRIGKQGGFLGMGRDNADDIFRGLTPEQAALVQIVEDAKKGRTFGVRPRPRLGMDGRPMIPPAPPLTPPATTNAPSASATNRAVELRASDLLPQRRSVAAVQTNAPAPEIDRATLAYIGGEYDPAASLYRQPAPAYRIQDDPQIQELIRYLSATNAVPQAAAPMQTRPAWQIAPDNQPVTQSWVSDFIAKLTGN